MGVSFCSLGFLWLWGRDVGEGWRVRVFIEWFFAFEGFYE